MLLVKNICLSMYMCLCYHVDMLSIITFEEEKAYPYLPLFGHASENKPRHTFFCCSGKFCWLIACRNVQEPEQKIYVTVGLSRDITTTCCQLLLIQVSSVSTSCVAGFVLIAKMSEQPEKLVSSSSSKEEWRWEGGDKFIRIGGASGKETAG